MRGEAQPGGRPPAPEPLLLVQAFVNTAIRGWDEDLLDDPPEFDGWLKARGFDPLRDDAERAWLREVREALHATLGGSNEATVLEASAARAGLRPLFSPARLEPEGEGVARTIGAILAAAWIAQADGSWRRLKTCPGDHCGWAFYDRSANASATWCSMRVCGQRAKAKTYYRRRVRPAR